MISSLLLWLLAICGFALLIIAALSPLETLSWWAGWTEEELRSEPAKKGAVGKIEQDLATLYVVYLSGVASLSGQFLTPREAAFVRRLEARLPAAKIISEVFPYSPSGLPLLAAPRLFERIWRRLQKSKLEGRRSVLSALTNIRNIFQVMISADHRYGPIFNRGAARVVEQELLRAGYKAGSGAPISIIGYSGGGQIGVGMSGFLTAKLGAPVSVIAIGGVMASDPGLHFLQRLDYLHGEKDNIEKLGAVMFPERWSAMAHSEWNAAKRTKRLVFHSMKNMTHAGPRGYFGLPKWDGVSNNERTLQTVLGILTAKPDPDHPRAAS